jgi:catechol 2,3-dioxygenase-like lactoylglutathione lyase family enzyme
MPVDHIGLNVPDLAAAKAYYDELMPLVLYEPFFATDDQFSYQPLEGKPGTRVFFYLGDATDYGRTRTGLQHLAFMVKTRRAVDAAYRWARTMGAEVVHEPQEFPQYHRAYFATFWIDPHGFLLEVVNHRDDQRSPAS